jgi:hypothetical protein
MNFCCTVYPQFLDQQLNPEVLSFDKSLLLPVDSLLLRGNAFHCQIEAI